MVVEPVLPGGVLRELLSSLSQSGLGKIARRHLVVMPLGLKTLRPGERDDGQNHQQHNGHHKQRCNEREASSILHLSTNPLFFGAVRGYSVEPARSRLGEHLGYRLGNRKAANLLQPEPLSGGVDL